MAKLAGAFGRFVRLNLTGQIVEVVDFDSTEITVKFQEEELTMAHYDVSSITPEEEAEEEAKHILG